MSKAKEYELHDTKRQYRIGCYRNQSNMLGAMLEQTRLGIDRNHLDCLLQRRDDRPIHLISGRDDLFTDWFEDNIDLGIELRLKHNTDVLGIFEWIQYETGYAPTCTDCAESTHFDLTRYSCEVTDGETTGLGKGGTETEAAVRAYMNFKEDQPKEEVANVCKTVRRRRLSL